MADKRQREVKVGSKSYEARAKKFDAKVPGATPFQDKLKEYELKAPTVGMFGEISKDGESILEIAAWKRADEYCTFFAFKPQVALSRIKQQMHSEVGHSSMLHIVRRSRPAYRTQDRRRQFLVLKIAKDEVVKIHNDISVQR